jgi:MFS transporter, DHA3 family, macrolide efflux protein
VTAAPPARVAVHATGRGRSGLAVLGNRSFVAILTARSISVAGNGFHFVAVSWLVLQLHGTVADLGVLLAASVVPGILLSLAGGVIIDRFDRRRLAQAMDVLRAAVVATAPLLLASGQLEIWHLYAITFGVGIGNSIQMPTYSAMLPEILDADDLVRGNGLWQMAIQTGSLLGAGFGGVVVATFSVDAALWIDVASYAAGVFLLQLVRRRATHHSAGERRASFATDLDDGVRTLVANGKLLVIGLLSLFPFTFVGVVNVLEAPFARDVLGVGVVGFGLLDAAFGLGSMVGGYICVRMLGDSSGTRRYSVVLLLAGGWGVVLALMPRLEGALAANLLLGLCITCANVVYPAFVQTRTPPTHVGRVTSTLQWVGSIAFGLVVLIVGLLGNGVSLRLVFIGLGGLLMVAGIIAWLILRAPAYAIDTCTPIADGLSGWPLEPALVLLVRLVAAVRRSGTLHIRGAERAGELYFRDGRLVGALYAGERGRSALEAIALTLFDATFTFGASALQPAAEIDLGLSELETLLNELARQRAALPPGLASLTGVPRTNADAERADADGPVLLDRGAIMTLLAVDGRRSVGDIAARHGMARTLHDLQQLSVAGLVRVAG